MGKLDNDGDVEEVQGSGAKAESGHVGSVGELMRANIIGTETGRTKMAAQNMSLSPREAGVELKLFGCTCEKGSHCDVSHDPSLCACEQCVLASKEAVSEFVEKRFRKPGPPPEVTRTMEEAAMGYDPIKDEKREFSFEEFVETASHELQQYKVALGGQNDFTRGKHTWNVWFRQFHEFMSW